MNRKKLLSFLISTTMGAAFALSATGCSPSKQAVVDPIDDNYRVFYQIFVGSFSDSDGDGIGDLRGVINRMDYLNDGDVNSGKSLGVQGIWLSPIFTSPSYHKYDATDYYTVDSKFGSEEDLKELIELCHARNVKLILDLAINHTSNKNDWFEQFKTARKSGDTQSPYYDFYTCVTIDEQISGHKYYPLSGTPLYYEGNFSSDMPELNFDNDSVREETVKVAKHYLDMGVDGFRFDAVKYIYYNDTAKSVDFWKWYAQQLRAINDDIYMVGECWSGSSEIIEYYPAINCFDFGASGAEGRIADATRSNGVSTFTNYIEKYQASILSKNPDAMYMPFISNHDMDRAAGFLNLSSGNAYMAANVYLLCTGSPMIYYGEEIGLKGTRGAANTDANRRLAMLWGDGDTVADPEGTTFDSKLQINGTVKSQLDDGDSLLNYYAKVIALRNKYPEIARGAYKAISGTGTIGGFEITYDGAKTCLIHNTKSSEQQITLPEGFTNLCDFIGQGEASIEGNVLTLGPQTSAIIK